MELPSTKVRKLQVQQVVWGRSGIQFRALEPDLKAFSIQAVSVATSAWVHLDDGDAGSRCAASSHPAHIPSRLHRAPRTLPGHRWPSLHTQPPRKDASPGQFWGAARMRKLARDLQTRLASRALGASPAGSFFGRSREGTTLVFLERRVTLPSDSRPSRAKGKGPSSQKQGEE